MLLAVFARQDEYWVFRKAFVGSSAEDSANEFVRVSQWLYPQGMEIRLFEDTGVVYGNSSGGQKNI